MTNFGDGREQLIRRLIFYVKDPDEERRFYEHLGLRTTYEGPDFIAVGNDDIRFGLSNGPDAIRASGPNCYQLGVSDFDTAIAACERAGLSFEMTTEHEGSTYRVLKLRSPSGMQVLVKEQHPPSGRLFPRTPNGAELVQCSFCGKSQKQVKKLIAGPGVYICDECVDLCVDILKHTDAEVPEPTSDQEIAKMKEERLAALKALGRGSGIF